MPDTGGVHISRNAPHEAGKNKTVVTGDIRIRSTLYGLPARPPTTRRRIDVEALRRQQGGRLPRVVRQAVSLKQQPTSGRTCNESHRCFRS
jgi:hypothetical protein